MKFKWTVYKTRDNLLFRLTTGPERSETEKSKVFAMEKLQLSHSVDCDILFCEFDSIFSVQDFVIIV